MRLRVALAILALLSVLACANEPASSPPAVNAATPASPNNAEKTAPAYVPVAKYDPARDPEADVQQAIVEARRTGKRILLELGGDWCVWCHIMDAYFEQHRPLLEERERNFLTVKINVSEENENAKFLSRYPKVPGYPHIFVLDSDGTFLHSQGTAELESGKSYDLARFSAFLKRWGTGA